MYTFNFFMNIKPVNFNKKVNQDAKTCKNAYEQRNNEKCIYIQLFLIKATLMREKKLVKVVVIILMGCETLKPSLNLS